MQYKGKVENCRPCSSGAYNLEKTERGAQRDGRWEQGSRAEDWAWEGRERKAMRRMAGRHAAVPALPAMVNRFGVAGRGEEGQGTGPLSHSSMQHASGFT